MDKIYAVRCSAGEFDDYHWWIAGMYINPLDAENLKQTILFEIDIAKKMPPPFLDTEYLTEEQFEIYWNWYTDKDEAEEFKDCTVVEMPLNVRYDKK